MIFKITSSTVIAIAAVILLFGMVASLTSGATSTRCTLEKNVIRHIPLPGYASRPLPPECTGDINEDRIKLESLDSNLLAFYIGKCWDKVDAGNYGKNLQCYELYATEVTETVDELSVTEELVARRTCEILGNSMIEPDIPYADCGTENQVYWMMTEPIIDKTTIIIKYNTLAQRIEII